MLEELQRIGNVRHDAAGQLFPQQRILSPTHQELDAAVEFGQLVNSVGRMTTTNLGRSDDERSFQRTLTGLDVDEQYIPLFRRYMEQASLNFLEQISDWCGSHDSLDSKHVEISVYLATTDNNVTE